MALFKVYYYMHIFRHRDVFEETQEVWESSSGFQTQTHFTRRWVWISRVGDVEVSLRLWDNYSGIWSLEFDLDLLHIVYVSQRELISLKTWSLKTVDYLKQQRRIICRCWISALFVIINVRGIFCASPQLGALLLLLCWPENLPTILFKHSAY